jgi:predicted RNase H-like nuclease
VSRFIGVDLAWGEGTAARRANETGLVLLDSGGTVLDAGWVRGIDAVAAWLIAAALPGDVIAIDAPMIVFNAVGMRECEREVGRRYGRWKVAANASSLKLGWLGGVTLRLTLEAAGFRYTDGAHPPAPDAIEFFECYPYTTLVGAAEFGYTVARPRYKRPALALPAGERRAFRAAECDDLLQRMSALATVDPPLDLRSHPVTSALLESPSPLVDAAYKHREDLLDAALCAWTAALWSRFGLARCQVLGAGDPPDAAGRRPVIIAPARPEQRRDVRAPPDEAAPTA